MADIRNDLRDAAYSAPDLTHERLAPTLVRYQEAGTLWYQPYASDVQAQTGRSALGNVTAHTQGAASTSYACGEIIDRQQMSYDAIRQSYRDNLRADLAMSRVGKRAVDDKIELAMANSLLANPIDLSASTNLPGDIEDMAWTLIDKAPGQRCVLTINGKIFTALKANAAIKDRMKNIGIAVGEGGDPRRVTAAQMAAVLGVDEVIVAPNRVWVAMVKAGTLGPTGAACGVLTLLPDGSLQPNEEVQLARVISYQYGETDSFPFEITSWDDDRYLGHVIDTKTKAQFVLLNSALKQSVQLIAADASDSGSASGSASASASA